MSSTVITSLSPSQGPASGGTAVTINGSGFGDGIVAPMVTFGATSASSVTWVSSAQLRATSPERAGGGQVNVTVTPLVDLGLGPSSDATAASAFIYTPAVTSLSPAFGPATGATTVTITGSGFGTGTPLPSVSFGGVPGTSVTYVSTTSLTAVSPASDPGGQVDVRVMAATVLSAIVPGDQFTYTPVVTAVSPAQGLATGGDTVTITGKGFGTGNPMPTVTFTPGGAATVTWVSGSQLTVVTPAGAVGTSDVTVTLSAQTSAISASDHFKYASIADLNAAVVAAQTAAAASPTPANQLAVVAALQDVIAAVAAGAASTAPYSTDAGLAAATTALPATQEALQTAKLAYQGSIASADVNVLPYEAASPAPLSTATIKNYQITVPNFQEVPSLSGVNTVIGPANPAPGAAQALMPIPTLASAASFLRLGSPPTQSADWSNSPFQNSVNLARLVGDPSLIQAAEQIAVTNGAISSNAYDDGNASTLAAQGSVSFAEAFADGTGVPSGTVQTFGTYQDGNFLLGFADDVRNRGPLPPAGSTNNVTNPGTTLISNTQVPNLPRNRQAETLKLLTKGGWWDHSDGNRVTTTSGDKIEVIQGNYKLVVLGRQAVPAAPGPTATAAEISAYQTAVTRMTNNTFVTDVSGGHFQEQYPSPTPCIKTIEYVQDAKGEWTLYQDNGLGNLMTKLKGRTVDFFQGPSRETYVGSNDAQTDSATGILLDPQLASYTWAQSVFSQTGTEDKPIGYDKKNGSFLSSVNDEVGSVAYGGKNAGDDDKGPQPGDVKTGDVVSKTWAQRVRSYTGSVKQHVKHVYSETHADEIETHTFAESILAVNGAINNSTFTLGITSNIQLGAAFSMLLGGKLDLVYPESMTIKQEDFDASMSRTAARIKSIQLCASQQEAVGQVIAVRGAVQEAHGDVQQVAAQIVRVAPAAIDLGASRQAIVAQSNTGV